MVLTPIISIVKIIKNCFSFSGGEDGKSGSQLENFLDYLVIYSYEVTDFLTDKTYETLIPTPGMNSSRKGFSLTTRPSLTLLSSTNDVRQNLTARC
jgi:hypothetical protein